MAKFRLWFLNRANDYDHAYLREQLEGDAFLGMGDRHEVEYGDRTGSTGTLFKKLREGELMYEHDDANEYFVPIALKCLGAPGSIEKALADVGAPPLSAEGKRRLAAMEAYYDHLYDPGESWKQYWTPNADPDNTRNMRMATAPYRGLYEVLLRCREADERHVLVGYSQGGVVARFLAYIDEHITKAGVVHGAITVQAPNWGSPFARPENAATVAEGILEAGAAIGRMSPGLFPTLATFIRTRLAAGQTVAGKKVTTIDVVVDLLSAAIVDYHKLKETDEAAHREREDLFRFLATAKKWLSGLKGDKSLAFYDLGLGRYAPLPNGEDPPSVLALLNKHPPRDIFYGAVAGANSSLVDFLRSMLTTWWMRLGFDWKLSDLRPLVEDAGYIYQSVVMKEAAVTGLPEKAQNRVKQYVPGILRNSELGRKIRLDRDIPPSSHDFIIPTVFQTVPEPQSAASDGERRFLGNYVNTGAAHISGASLEHRGGGKRNQELVGKMLATIAASTVKEWTPPWEMKAAAPLAPAGGGALADADP